MGSLLRHYEGLPEGLLQARPTQLSDVLGGPSLIHLPGRRLQPLFVSVLLHGNETTGFLALQALLAGYQGKELPRALSIFIGNVEAARDGLRRLAGQPDYNRVWPGSEHTDSPEKRMMAEVVDIMQRRLPFASVDVHNNTGINPHYACINRIEHRFMHLASVFSRTLVYFIRPAGVQSMAFAQLCPAITVECGKVGQTAGEVHAQEFLDACLHLSQIPDHPVAAHDVDLFHTVATVRVPGAYSFGFGEQPVDICFIDDLDHLNFDMLRTTRALMPSMFTLDERVIRQDCLGYLMERYPLPD
jgi:hypothetical protein